MKGRIVSVVIGLGVVAVVSGALLGAGVFPGGSDARRQVCDNSSCLLVPAGWDGRSDSGSIAGWLTTAPFTLPDWVGRHEQGVIVIPKGRFVISLLIYDRGYLYGWQRVKTIGVSSHEDQFATANRLLATLHPAPPPAPTD